MGLTIRHYILPEEGPLRRVPRRVADALAFGNDAIPEFASTRQKVAEVFVENDGGKPLRILEVIGSFWDFDEAGRIDVALSKTMREWMDVALGVPDAKKDGTVVDLVPELKKKGLHERHRWTVTKEDIDRIATDLWPGINGPAPDVTAVKGKAPKRPLLTPEARLALQRLNDHVNAIKNELNSLSERALKGLGFEAVRSSMWEDEALWRGVADEAKRLEAIRAAHRTGRGEWYAVIEVARASREYTYLWEHVTTAHEKCSSRKAAVDAGRRLMAEKIDWLDANMELSVNVRSVLEWRPDDWD